MNFRMQATPVAFLQVRATDKADLCLKEFLIGKLEDKLASQKGLWAV